MKVEDLDVLRPAERLVRIGGKDIDVSFIPCGITFDVDSIVSQLYTLDVDKMSATSEETRKAFDLSIKLCSTFCARKNPEMDEEWFRDNTDARQIKTFTEAIKDALMKAYMGAEGTSKNAEAPKRKKR